jgi:hypothetical protein
MMRPSLFCSRAQPRLSTVCSRAQPRASTSLIRLLLGALSVWLLALPDAHASLVEALDLATLVAESDQVVVAHVLSLDSHFDEQGQIVTDVVMQVEESVKGELAPGAAVTVRRKGGTVGDIGMRVSGEPSFSVGETVLLFAARNSGGVLRPVGMSQGALRVFEKDGARWARGANGGASTVKRGKGGKLEHAPSALPVPRRLDELLGELRSLADKR